MYLQRDICFINTDVSDVNHECVCVAGGGGKKTRVCREFSWQQTLGLGLFWFTLEKRYYDRVSWSREEIRRDFG